MVKIKIMLNGRLNIDQIKLKLKSPNATNANHQLALAKEKHIEMTIL